MLFAISLCVVISLSWAEEIPREFFRNSDYAPNIFFGKRPRLLPSLGRRQTYGDDKPDRTIPFFGKRAPYVKLLTLYSNPAEEHLEDYGGEIERRSLQSRPTDAAEGDWYLGKRATGNGAFDGVPKADDWGYLGKRQFKPKKQGLYTLLKKYSQSAVAPTLG